MSHNIQDINLESASSTELNMVVASNCSGFDSLVKNNMISGDQCEVSCDNCRNFQNKKCVVNLYDEVLCNLEENKQ
ncbi:hypothetical protein G8S49_13130 [Clostridium botulinum C]|uniref:Uncharacterized protein n=3 Tax=Clostridium botulinum TaxID=1491 RepID=A0A9Q4TIT3_CLOBO|nr:MULTISPECIES: hypothetical protein [Clostridium]EGO87602.1 hypothetical protein CBCST_10801 [Clostridium botulinum C str. Stockholm]AYF53980.1 hypothetical protein DFH04_04215 [Clostridium novyi]EES90508.1 conserved hypothetical protein [Clostridium botulinum D str. 1873]KEI09908.1 hypothetical protein Z957_03485 [Clostridium sp. K25]MBO3441041.1 hypothetical protein [Clostridium haemolyticum]